MANNTIVAAAAQAGVNERTIRRWLSGDVDIQPRIQPRPA